MDSPTNQESTLSAPAALRAAPYLTPTEVYRQLAGEYTGPSIARAIAAYHAIVTGQELPPVPGLTWPD